MSKAKEVKAKKGFYANMTYAKKRSFWGVILLLPWLIGLLVFFLGPLVRTFYYSLFEMKLETNGFSYNFVGFDNYHFALFVTPDFNKKVVTALADTAKNVPIQIFVSLFVAMLLIGEYKARGFFRLVFFVPIILATGITTINVAAAQVTAETSQKFVNTEFLMGIIRSSGVPATFISTILEFANSIFEIITTAGVQMLIFMAGLQGISPTLYEVAKIEGCTKFESFCKITLPMISPMILVCTIYSLADSFAKADITDLITTTTYTSAKYGLGATMSALYFLISLFVILVVSGLVSKGVFYYDK